MDRQNQIEQTRRFLYHLVDRLSKNQYIEIRFVKIPETTNHLYMLLKGLKAKYPHIPFASLSQLFIKDRADVDIITSFAHSSLLYGGYSKVCYGVNPRTIDHKGTIDGSYKSLKSIHRISMDLDIKNIPDSNTPFTRDNPKYRDVFVLMEAMDSQGLSLPTIIHSGGGIHLLYDIEETNVTDGRRSWYKEFINYFSERYTTDAVKFDALKDFTRILSLPGTPNVKRDRFVQTIHHDARINTNFVIRSKKKVKKEINHNVQAFIKDANVAESLVWKILINNPLPPTGARYTSLLFPLKCLLRETNTDPEPFEDILNEIYGDVILDVDNMSEAYEYNPFAVFNWCLKNMSWMDKNPELKKLFHKERQDVQKGFRETK